MKLVSYFDHKRFVFTDETPMKGIDIYNKKIYWSPLDGTVPFVDTGFDTHNIYNLMAAIKISKNENSHKITSTRSITYQVGDNSNIISLIYSRVEYKVH